MICHTCKMSAQKKQQKTSYLEDPGFKVANTCSMEQPDGKFNSFTNTPKNGSVQFCHTCSMSGVDEKNTCNFRYHKKTDRTAKTPKKQHVQMCKNWIILDLFQHGICVFPWFPTIFPWLSSVPDQRFPGDLAGYHKLPWNDTQDDEQQTWGKFRIP